MANSVPSSYPRYPKRHSKREKKVIETALSAGASAPFTPDDSDDWSGPPETVAEALDELAQRVTDGAYTPNDAEDWGEPAPTSIVAAIDTLAARVQALEDAAQ